MTPSAGANPGPGPAAAHAAVTKNAMAQPVVAQNVVAQNVVAKITVDLDATRQALLSSQPTSIDDCLPRLEKAAAELLALRDGWREAPPQAHDPRQAHDYFRLRRDLHTVLRDLARLAGLAHSGARLYQGLARLLGAAGGGYTPLGEAVPLRPPASVLLRG